jgi:N-acetylmuramoyl-L-alanine amidase
MYALWYPSTNSGQGAVVANSGATIGGQFAVRVVVQPEPGEGSIITAGVTQQSIRELTNAHAVTSGQLAEFQRVNPDPQYGDPTSNVVVLESPFVNFAGHNATYQIDVTVSYLVQTNNPPPNDRRTVNSPPVSMTLTMSNLLLVDSRPEPYFVWKPDEMTGVVFSAQLQHAQAGTCTVKLEIFRTEDNQNPIFARQFDGVSRPGTWSWTWDGKLADGVIAPRGVYTYRLSALAYVPTLPDSDSDRSESLRITQTRLEVSEDRRLWFRYYLSEAGRDGSVLAFDPSPQEVIMWDVDVATNAGWNSLEVALPPPTEESPPGSIRYLALIRDRGDANGMDKAHRSRWALPLNARVPVCLVIIDPGHDRTHNPGSHGEYNNSVYWEKDITLTYAGTLKAQLRGILTAGYPGHDKEPHCTRVPVAWKTELTRTGDVSFPPEDRKAKVKRLVSEWLESGGTTRSVFLVSLHCDGSLNPEVRGVGVIYCNQNPWGSAFRDYVAGWIRDETTEQEVPTINYWECLDVKNDHLYILRQAFLPEDLRVRAVLVELGFITNTSDLGQMLDRFYRLRESRAIHYGCDSYFEYALGGNP